MERWAIGGVVLATLCIAVAVVLIEGYFKPIPRTTDTSLPQPAVLRSPAVVTETSSLYNWVHLTATSTQLSPSYYFILPAGTNVHFASDQGDYIVPNADITTFEFAVETSQGTSTELKYARDKNYVYVGATPLEGIDIPSFIFLPWVNSLVAMPMYAKDIRFAYNLDMVPNAAVAAQASDISIPGADVASFSALYDVADLGGDELYARDKNRVYGGSEAIPEIDAQSISLVGGRILKDRKTVYAPLTGIDPATFTYLGNGFFRDKNHVYCWAAAILPVEDIVHFTVLPDGRGTDNKSFYSAETCAATSRS